MTHKTQKRILYELERFGIPTRDHSLRTAQSMITQGLLTQDQVDQACQRYETRIREENIKKYGVANPTDQRRKEEFIRFVEEKRKELEETERPKGYVGMWAGKYSFGEELRTASAAGCIATLLYFEREGRREGIFTHYPCLHVDQNIARIEELRDENMGERHDLQRGIVLALDEGLSVKCLQTAIRALFPGIEVNTVTL